jgi:DnaJ-class molecular chaperone
MSTPETNQALAEILERDGELSEYNAPAVLVKFCRKMERERDEWKEKAERLQAACNKWSEDEILLTHCQNCKEFRGHGHQRKSEPPEPPTRNCRECCGQGQVEIQSGPYMTQCPECNGTGKQTNQLNP